jgi:hypothetical protein
MLANFRMADDFTRNYAEVMARSPIDYQSGTPGQWDVAISIPRTTQAVLDAFEKEVLTDAERKGAWAEATPFNFMPAEENPWGTHYRPVASFTEADGSASHARDLGQVDEEIIEYWEQRSSDAQHPVLRARYADVVWDLKKKAIGKPANASYALRAIDAYLEGVAAQLYKEASDSILASKRALELSLSLGDKERTMKCKQAMRKLFSENLDPLHIGASTILSDSLTASKKVGLEPNELASLIDGLESILRQSTTTGPGLDPFGAEAAARRLASHYERQGDKSEAQRAIRSYGEAFEQLSAGADSMLAMAWLQPVYEEYKNRGLKEDAERVLVAIAEKGKTVASELRQISVPVELTEKQLDEFIKPLIEGSTPDALLRITASLMPKAGKVRELLEELKTKAPLMAPIGVTRIVGDHFAASAGSIEEDPEGRLIMQLAQHIDFYNFALNRALDHLWAKNGLDADTIMASLDESPVFTPERRPLLEEGVKAYVSGDYKKAIHVIIPQIEQALRQLLVLTGVPTLKAARGGLFHLKNLNDILRETTVTRTFGDDTRLYLQTLLADERGQNIRNKVTGTTSFPPWSYKAFTYAQRLRDDLE